MWASAAMLATMLLLMDSIYFFLGTRGILIEHVRMAFTGKYGPPASISVVNGGTKLLLTGALQEGSAEAFAAAINNAPSATVIRSGFEGGRPAAGGYPDCEKHFTTRPGYVCKSGVFVGMHFRFSCREAQVRSPRVHEWVFTAASYVHDLSKKTFQNIAAFQRDQYLKAGLAEGTRRQDYGNAEQRGFGTRRVRSCWKLVSRRQTVRE